MQPEDLSRHHAPVTDLAAENAFEPTIGPAAAEKFDRDGFITCVPVLSGRQVARLQVELDEMMRPECAADGRFYEFHINESGDPDAVVFHALGAWRVSPAFHDLIFLPSLVNAAAALLGGPVRLWHDQIFVKPPRHGGVVAWHQDRSYWTRTRPAAHLTCWIALDDTTTENGCVNYVPGSHRWPLLPRGELAKGMDAVRELLTDEQIAAFRPVAAELPAGYANFHHSMTLHGSFENRSDRPRRGVVVNFIRDGVLSDSDEPLLEGVPVIPAGEKLQGRFFPLLGPA